VPLEEIERAIRIDVCKGNIDTDLRMALTGSVRECVHLNPASFDIHSMMKGVLARMEALCVECLERFGAVGGSGPSARRCVLPRSLIDLRRSPRRAPRSPRQ